MVGLRFQAGILIFMLARHFLILIQLIVLAAPVFASAADSSETKDIKAVRRQTKTVPPLPVVNGASSPHFQISAMGGLIAKGRNDLDSKVYKHEFSQSPAGRLGIHYSFSPERSFQVLIGVEALALRHVQIASSASATATYTADDFYLGPAIGLSWLPGGPDHPFQLQALLSVGKNLSKKGTLQSAGFIADLPKVSMFRLFAAWAGLYGAYAVTPKWRLTGGLVLDGGATPLMVGGAYAF